MSCVSHVHSQVADCVENFEYELALQYCEAALVVAPSNINVLETTGGLLLDFGDIERATQISCLIMITLKDNTENRATF